MNFLIRLIEFKKYFLKKENIFFFIFVITIFFLDRLSKLQIINNLNESPYYVNDYINFDLIWNIGIGFGLLSTNSSLLYNFVTILIGIVIILLLYIFAFSNKIDKFIYSIIIGGALGNFYDRITYKAVPDFVDLHYENFHWFTFNVADIFISLGITIFLIRSFFINN
jgi:signal peptidase II